MRDIRKGENAVKKIIILAVSACIGIAVLSACGAAGGKSAAPNAYRVIVSDESGDPVEGVTLQFCSDSMCLKKETGSNGAAIFETEEGTYTVHVIGVPEGYAEDKTEYKAPETYGDVSITIKKAE